jgi:hypothetical protein
MNLKTESINFWQMYIYGFPLKFLNDIEKYVQICFMLLDYMLLSWKNVSMCTNNFSFGKVQVLFNILVLWFSDLLQKKRIIKTRERGKKHHEERRKLLRPAKNLPGLQQRRRFPLWLLGTFGTCIYKQKFYITVSHLFFKSFLLLSFL